MDAKARSLCFLGNEPKKLTVPFFQRHYVWTQANWSELLESLDSSEVQPFFGSIILKMVETPFKPSEANIIDGQQRLTTLTILVKAIYDSLPADSRKESGIRRGVESYLYFTINASDSFGISRLKIEHSRVDIDAYIQVIEAGGIKNETAIDLDSIAEESSPILRCYKFFRNMLMGKTVEELMHLYDRMFNDDKPILVLVLLGVNDVNEQTIFDTINRAGIRLSTADIIKNSLFKKCLDKIGTTTGKETVCSVYDDKWAALFYQTTEELNIWDRKRIFGNAQRSNLEFLLYCVACIKWGKQKESFAGLEKVYDEETKNYDYPELLALVEEINYYGRLYKTYILDFQDKLNDETLSRPIKYKEHVYRLLLILEKFGVQMFYPYVLKSLAKAKENLNDEELIKNFKILESFIIRRRLSPKGVNDYADKCNIVLKEGIQQLIDNDLACVDSVLKDTDVRTYIDKVKDDTAKMLLFCIELYRRKDDLHDISALEYCYTLEHVMPKSWSKYWGALSIIDMDGNVYAADSEEGVAYRNSHVQSLGNLTLLTTNLNSSIRNADFSTKVEGNGETRPGYRFYSSLGLTKEIVAQYDKDKTWNEKSIKERTDCLFTEIVNLWPSYKELASEPVIEADSSAESAVDADPQMEQFDAATLADPIKVLKALVPNG